MASVSPADIRNIVLVGHGGCGKTTLTERLLFASGATTRMGTVEEGNTVSDWTPEEIHHKHSLAASTVHLKHDGKAINLVDTPGLADFLGHAVAAMPAAETVACVVDAAKGVETTTRREMQIAADRRIPRMIIVNKMDHPDADLPSLVETIRSVFGTICVPVNLPKNGGKDVVNVFDHRGDDDAGDDADFSSVHEAHQKIVEQIVEVDENLMGEYLEKGDKIAPEELHRVFEKALEDAHLVPIVFCSAKTGAGIPDLLHVMTALCPSPVEVNPPEFQKRETPEGDDVEWHAKPDPAGKLLAHVFKVAIDPFVGKLAYVRVHQGTLKAKTDVIVNDQKKPVKIGHLVRVQGKQQEELHEAGPGEIVAIAKLDELKFNDVIHDSHELDSVHLAPLAMPKPMFGLAIELKNHADETKFAGAMHKIMEEDPCLKVERIAATKQTVLRGLGELHLRITLEKLKQRSNIEVLTSTPKVAYKETITAKADGHHRHKKQTGGSGQFGEVYLRVEPLPTDHAEGFEFVNETVGGSIPRQFMPAIEKGVRMVLGDGAVAGYPLTGVKVTVYDGKYHAVDSKEIAFVAAGKRAFIDGVAKARPVLLEPFVNLEITVPSKYMGDIAGDIAGRRGRVQATEMLGDEACVVRASAPLAELQTYSTELKSMTGGTGTYTMEFSHDEPTPTHIQAEVVAAYKPHHEED